MRHIVLYQGLLSVPLVNGCARIAVGFTTTSANFIFSIVNTQFIHVCSNIPAAPSYEVYISQLIRYSKACSSYQNFLNRWLLLTRKLLHQGFLLVNCQFRGVGQGIKQTYICSCIYGILYFKLNGINVINNTTKVIYLVKGHHLYSGTWGILFFMYNVDLVLLLFFYLTFTRLGLGFMVFNTTFNNISVISWRSVLLVEETGGPWENHRPVTSHWQTNGNNSQSKF
jgi:hypothetical protein